MKTITLTKTLTLYAVWWDGTFASINEFEKHKIFEGIQYNHAFGQLTYLSEGTIQSIPRERFVVRDGDRILTFSEASEFNGKYGILN